MTRRFVVYVKRGSGVESQRNAPIGRGDISFVPQVLNRRQLIRWKAALAGASRIHCKVFELLLMALSSASSFRSMRRRTRPIGSDNVSSLHAELKSV